MPTTPCKLTSWRVRLATIAVGVFALSMAVTATVGPARAATFSDPGFFEQTYVSGLSGPVAMAWLPDGRLLVAEQSGVVKLVEIGGSMSAAPFIDISSQTNAARDRGLLGLAVHPSFPTIPYVYLSFTYEPPEAATGTGNGGPDGKGARVSRVIRVTASATTSYATAIPGSEVVLMGTNSTAANIGDLNKGMDDLSQTTCEDDVTGEPVQDCLPADGESHTVGSVRFGPDGMVYVGNGEASSYLHVDSRSLRALDLDSMAGKIFRIDPITGAGLPDNPFWDGDPASNRSKVYSYGLRNPFRFTVDPNSGELFIGDVGWGAWEEINTGEGRDFGWPCYEGGTASPIEQSFHQTTSSCIDYYATASSTAGAYAWNHIDEGGAALAGLVYTATSVYPDEYTNGLLIADYVRGWIKRLPTDGAGSLLANATGDPVVQAFAEGVGAMVDFSQSPDGHIYYVNFVTNSVVRLSYNDFAPPPAVAYEYYEGPFSALPDFDSLTALRTGFVSSFTLEPAASPSHFAFRFRSCLAVPASDTYTFSTFSDDGSNLHINGALVVNNDGLHSASEQSGSVTLATGRVPIDVGFFEVTGRETLSVNWESSTIPKTEIPFEALVPCDAPLTPEVASIDFSATASTSSHVIRLAHAGPAGSPAVQINSIDFFGANASDFASSQLLPTVIEQGDSVDLPVTFHPSVVGPVAATMSINHTGTNSPTALSLNGESLNSAPTIAILQPSDDRVAKIGSIIALSATADDAEDGPGDVAIEWTGILHHNDDHVHPNVFNVTGPTGSFVLSDHDDNTYIEVCATATDSSGASTTDCVNVFPVTVAYTFATVPPGLDLSYNGVTRETPFVVQAVVGATRSIAALAPQANHTFDSWSVHGPAAHNITIQPQPTTVTATYTVDP